MKTNQDLIKLLERCHPFLTHALCTIPDDNKDYLEAQNLCNELDSFLYPAVKEAFNLDRERQNIKLQKILDNRSGKK